MLSRLFTREKLSSSLKIICEYRVSLNPIKPGGHFCPWQIKIKLFLNDLWYEPKTLWLLLTFTRDYFAKQKFEKMLIFQGVTYFFSGGVVKKCVEIMFTNPEIVLVAEINMYMYKKWLVLHHLILSKDCAAHFPNQLF